ncbi:geranylgeranyl diphosphate synthase type I [Nocardia tenerifensis]|uniref:Geranylgeranyl diphosphate synthase type I n=2 Tax=Nocardia tenerifensis TaxID=228006 RepID=A0A318JV53_9NOCA|nr:polyprenyl synthetase family protein [Nocardia tenerifensis]PXX60984.1 geranylgeranyl diphosphate synthase type I [Nocardia tenerifensis]
MVESTSAATSRRAGEILTSARKLCDPVLREAVSSLPEPLRLMGGYHFGWWDAEGAATPRQAGKALRPALTVCSAVACGATARAALAAAAAVELVHNFTLLHDDVMDGDQVRRGRPAVWTVWGIPDALLLGDALHALAIRVLVTGLPGRTATAAIARLESAVIEMCHGQHQDCRFRTVGPVDVEEYARMAMGKTGALMGCACALGAVCARADPPTVSAMDTFGRELGMAFQFVDDLIGIWGDPEITGKPASDLARQAMSLPVVSALGSGTAAAAELATMYGRDPAIDSMDTARAAALVESAGGRERTRRLAERRVRAAIAALTDPASAADLMALAGLVSDRNH